VLLATLVANVLAAPRVAAWMHPRDGAGVVVLEKMDPIISGAWSWHDTQGNEALSDVLMDAMGAVIGAEDLLDHLRKVLGALGGRLVRLDLAAMAAKHAAAINSAAPTNAAPDTDELRRVGEKMMTECRKLQQRQALTPLATLSSTASVAAAEAAPPPQLLPFTVVSGGRDEDPAAAAWCASAETCVRGASDEWMSALQDTWGMEWAAAGAVASTVHCKTSCATWGIPAILDSFGVTIGGGGGGGGGADASGGGRETHGGDSDGEDGAGDNSWELEENRRAAVTVQRHVRGWSVRRSKANGTLRGAAGGVGGHGGTPAGGAPEADTGTAWASGSVGAAAPNPVLFASMMENHTLIFLTRALTAAGVISQEQARVASGPKDLWWACRAGAPAIHGMWQPSLSAGGLRWCFSRQPPAPSADGSPVPDPHAQGPFPLMVMRQQWAALLADTAAYPNMRVWQDGLGEHTGRHPSHFEHILGEHAQPWSDAAAADFWNFAHVWGRETAAANNLIFNELPELHRQSQAYLGVAPSSDLTDATARIKTCDDMGSFIHSSLGKLNAFVRPEVFSAVHSGHFNPAGAEAPPWRQGPCPKPHAWDTEPWTLDPKPKP